MIAREVAVKKSGGRRGFETWVLRLDTRRQSSGVELQWFACLEVEDLKFRNELEMTEICRSNAVAKLQRCNPDQ